MIVLTPIYAAIIAILFLYLSARVINVRRSGQISIGDGNNPDLLRRMRAHANCAEYAPLIILLIAFIELGGAPAWQVHAPALLLVTGRILHGLGFGGNTENMTMRKVGMVLTFLSLLMSALLILSRPFF